MVAVAPLFVACTSADVDCDHSRHDTTRILVYDQRAGGSGICAQLYRHLRGALRAAIDLLEECTSCYLGKDYDGGCPGCLQSVPCDNFHQDLSRAAGIRVGKHLLGRLERSNLASKEKVSSKEGAATNESATAKASSRQSKLRSSPKRKNIVVGRASWMEKDRTRWAEVDDI